MKIKTSGHRKVPGIHRLHGPVLFALLILISLSGSAVALKYSDTARDQVKKIFYPESLVRQMKADGARVNGKFRTNFLSTCQYGSRLIAGEVDTGDVLDLRVKTNRQAFYRFAREHLLVQNVPPSNHYERYSTAATRFMRQLGYHCILFYPDEFNPVFTTPGDTWMFIREDPVKKEEGEKYYYSPQVRNRRFIARGGVPMEACRIPGLEHFYVPVPGSKYTPFELTKSRMVETTELPEKVNRFTPIKVTEKMRKKRRELGIIPCPLSGTKNLTVATWGQGGDLQHQAGFRFTGREDLYTWGDCGFYVIPVLPVEKGLPRVNQKCEGIKGEEK